MRLKLFGWELEFRKETEDERKERAEREFRERWGIEEKKPAKVKK